MTEAPQVPAVEIISPKVVKWAERINSAARKGLKSILAVCYEVFLAHEDCLRGEWLQLIDSGLLVFKRAHVYRLLKVGTELERFQKLPLGVTLPADTHTLWSLASLSLERFHKLIENGTINPSMKRNEASAETRKERKEEDERRILGTEPAPGKHRTIIIDPPWNYELNIAGRAQPAYATMTHEDLLALDVAELWAYDDCHLYCWTTNSFMTRACDLVAHWGFEHKTILTWVKPRFVLGSYFRNSTEHVIFAVRGTLSTRVDDIATHFEAPLGEHSEKPEIFYDIVRRASYPPYGEIFQREEREDFPNLYRAKEAVA